jgi:hypothetical protein
VLIRRIANHHLAAISWMDSELDEARKQLEKLWERIAEIQQNNEVERNVC